jgi:glyoxylase-like metal-dependent hydrolase (beta-lactamase superfamily II)
MRPFSELGEGLFVLNVPMFPLYVIRGGGSAMVDCAVLSKAGEIQQKLAALLGNERLAMALLTHSHYDHVGACSLLQETHGFAVVASQRTKDVLDSDKAVAFIDDLNQKFKALEIDLSDSRFTRPHSVRAVAEGDRVELPGGRELEVYETPGHTRCSLAFLLRPGNVLFAGDAAGVVERSGRIKPLFLSSYSMYEASLQKLLGLDADTLALAHNAAVQGRGRVRKFLEDSLAETRRLKERIIAWLGESRDFARIAERILEEEYDAPTLMGPREAMLINVTAMVKSVFHGFVKET